MIPASWLPLAAGARFTQPRDHSLADPCTCNILKRNTHFREDCVTSRFAVSLNIHTYLDVRVQVGRPIALVDRASDAVHLLHDHITVEPQLGLLRLQLRSPVRHGGHGRRGAAVGTARARIVLVIASYQTVLKEERNVKIVN